MPKYTPIEFRFWTKVDKNGPVPECLPELGSCWLWMAAQANGYGTIRKSITRTMLQAHRVSYELVVGPIPDGYEIDHLCRNPLCVNPAHLDAVTPKVNTNRNMSPVSIAKRSGVCLKGHAMISGNVLVDRKTGYRRCRICRNSSKRGQYHKEKDRQLSESQR